MPLVSVSLRPDMVVFDTGNDQRKFPTNGSPCAYEIAHRDGKVIIEVKDGNLFFGFPSRGDLPPSITATTSWHLAPDGRLYPEVLFGLAGIVEISCL
ncbi:hypothetical protein [Mycobacterium sp. IS-836]|uniref:hypothetical protein n=1 Tax=Mycobacterium sp. IS-836 TaxID=1834160 RepID=UPI001153436E|nr:hypothetical protein [Mycobacterium sp. IS-836]